MVRALGKADAMLTLSSAL